MGKRSKRDRPRGDKAPAQAPAPVETAVVEPPVVAPATEAPLAVEANSPVEAPVIEAPAIEAPAPVEPPAPVEEPARVASVRNGARESRASNGLGGFFLHLHPRLARRRTLSARATLGLGVASLVALAVVTLSGLLLLIHYVPSVERAHASLQDLVTLVPFGAFLRRLHRLSGHALVLFAILHLLRTLLWGSYRGEHRRVWLLGALLLLCTLATSYSGYLLPWDQDAYWTVTVGSSLFRYLPLCGEPLRELMLGGSEVGQAALTRFFVLHVLALPGLGLLLLVLHLFRLRRAGGLARGGATAGGPAEELVPASPELPRRELALTLAVVLALTLLSLLAYGLELGPAPDLARPDNPPKAPWFLVGLQELVSYSASFGGVLFPTLLVGLLVFLPWLDGGARSDGEPLAARGARLAIPIAGALVAATAVLAIRWWGDPQAGKSSWLNPASLASLVALATSGIAGLRWRSRSLFFQTLLAGLLAALLVFTVVGWFWRGPDWGLAWHPGPGRGLP